MSILRRYFTDHNVCFITSVTCQRQPILLSYAGFFLESLKKYQAELGFVPIAFVLMPDHFHLLFDSDTVSPASVVQRIKISVSKKIRNAEGRTAGAVWQHRYWDHMIRNREDLRHHFDYIHYNPVKHGYADSPFDWEYSTARFYRDRWVYDSDWGMIEMKDIQGEYGE